MLEKREDGSSGFIFVEVDIIQDVAKLHQFIFRQRQTFGHRRMFFIPRTQIELFASIIPAGIGQLFFPSIGSRGEISSSS